MARKRVTQGGSLIDKFTFFARKVAFLAGSPWTFISAILIIIIWMILGPVYEYSTTWQLVINSFTTIVTFLMVFIIQNTQNRDSRSIELKLDELLEEDQSKEADEYIKVEDLSEEEIDMLSKRFEKLKSRKSKSKKR